MENEKLTDLVEDLDSNDSPPWEEEDISEKEEVKEKNEETSYPNRMIFEKIDI